MRQEIFDDPHAFDVWDLRASSRCFVHIANSLDWRAITGDKPPTTPPTSRQYSKAGLPWFEYYGGDKKALKGAKKLAGMKTVKEMGDDKGENPLPENETVEAPWVIGLAGGKDALRVREGEF
jgi:hypothetical protein